MFNLDDITNENSKEHNENWLCILVGCSGSGKTDTLLNFIAKQDSNSFIAKIYLYAKDLIDLEYQFLIKKREDVRIKHLNDSKAFKEYSKCMDDVYNNIDDYSPSRKIIISIAFHDMIADIMSNQKSQAMVKVLFVR